jgi:hypothetical protein
VFIWFCTNNTNKNHHRITKINFYYNSKKNSINFNYTQNPLSIMKRGLTHLKNYAIMLFLLAYGFNNVYAQISSNQALHFKGSNDTNDNFVAVEHNESLNLTSATFEVWVNWEGTENISNLFMKTGNESIQNYGWGVGINKNGELEWWQQYLQGAGLKSKGNTIKVNTWTHIAVSVVHNGEIKFYINGVLSGKDKKAMIMNGNGKLIIGKQGTDNNYFNGKMDELRIWNTVLTEKQIKANMYKELKGDEKNLLLYCDFNEIVRDHEKSLYVFFNCLKLPKDLSHPFNSGIAHGDGMFADSNPKIISNK